MLGACNRSKYGNCLEQDSTRILTIPKDTKDSVAAVVNAFEISDTTTNQIYLSAVDTSTEYSNDVLTYIREHIQKIITSHNKWLFENQNGSWRMCSCNCNLF